MKKIGIIIALLLSCPLVHAQWTLSVNYTNNCTDMWERLRAELEAERIVNENNNRTFSTKNECDAARRTIQSPYSCLKFDCHCMGHDAGGTGDATTTVDPVTNSYFTGPQQGAAFSPANEADQIKQWLKDYYKQNGIDYDEAYLDELFENMYARKEFEQMYAQAHAQMMETNDRESYSGGSDSIKQRYLVTTKSGYIYEELNMEVKEETIANPVYLDEDGRPYLNLNAIQKNIDLPELSKDIQPEPVPSNILSIQSYSTSLSDESESNFGQSLSYFLYENKNVYAVEQYVLGELGEVIDKVTLSIAEGLATLVEMPAYPLAIAQNLMNAEVDFCQEGMDAILWAASHDITNENTRKAFERKYKKATVNFGFNLTGSGGEALKAANFLYNVRYGKD